MARYALLCICIVLNCSTAAAPFLFNLFGPTLTKQMGLSMSQTNAIALGAILGQYASALFMGAFADKSARLSSLLASILFISGYSMMSISLSRSIPPSYAWFIGYYVLSGSGTVASYFAALTASAKSFPDHPGLAIGVPSALFGISPLLLSTVGSALFTISEGENAGDIDVVGLFAFFGIVTGLVNFFSACFIQPIIIPEPEEKLIVDDAAVQSADETQPLLPTLAHPPHQNVVRFLKQSNPWIFVLIVLLVNGPCEVISQNLGSLSEALIPASATDWPDHRTLTSRQRQIQIFSAVNTLTRLVFGALSDYTSPPIHGSTAKKAHFTTPRIAYIQFAASILLASSLLMVFAVKTAASLWTLSVGSGLTYGLISTIGPSLVSRVWGEADFGRNFGILWSIAAIGPLLFGLLYGEVSDHFAREQNSGSCKGVDCFRFTFIVISIGSITALLLISFLGRRKTWRRV